MLSPRYVDSREAAWRLHPLERAGFQRKQLVTGDVSFPEFTGEVVLVENKTVGGLLSDMTSGILLRQMRRMCEETRWPILLVEGRWQQSNGVLLNTQYTWEQAWNQLQTLQDMGARLQLTTSPEHTVQRILELAEYYAKEYHPSATRQPAGDTRIAVLSLIHGIDRVKAQALIDRFESLLHIADVLPAELEEVKGIGPVLSQRIYQFFTHKELNRNATS